MPLFSVDDLATWTQGCWSARPSTPLTGFAIDTRQLRPGQVFVALRTEKRDGHDFLGAAQAAGAVAALVARPVADVALPQLVVADPLEAFQVIARQHRLRFRGPVVGVTGSAGKTSTKNLLARVLGPAALATEGNLNNHLGVPLTLTRLDPAQHTHAVIEAGIGGPGEMAPLGRMIEPDVAVVTLIGHAHTAELGGLEGVAREKAVLPHALRPDGLAVFPSSAADYASFKRVQARRQVAYPVDMLPREVAEGRVAFQVGHEVALTHLTIQGAAEKAERYALPRVTDGMAQNAVLAITVARALGVSPADIRMRLADWAPAALRGEVRRTSDQLLYLDCYNANPSSMADALTAFECLAPAELPRLYVLGGMEELGAASAEHHRELGARLRLRPQDHALVIGGEAAHVQAGALAAGAPADHVVVMESLEPIARRIGGFRGAVFVKGSRKYRLEEALPGRDAPPSGGAH